MTDVMGDSEPMAVTGSVDVQLDGVASLLRMKVRRPGTSGWGQELKTGMEVYRDTGELHEVYQHVDHDNDWYTKRVVSPTLGVVRDVSEPLSQHRDRGAAKPRAVEQDD